MAESDTRRPPTIAPVPSTAPDKAPSAATQPTITLPPETIRRWQEIVRQALLSGRDISVLVQQYAEQSFNTKLGALDTQGARRRMLARAHASLERERIRAEGHLEAQPTIKPPIMTRSYQANAFTVPSPTDPPPAAPPARGDKKVDIEWHHTTTPIEDPFTKRAELEAHVAKITAQMQIIDRELPVIDAVLNKGLRNQQNVVNELAAVSRELYRLAQQVQVELPAKRVPTDGSGYQKSTKKKEAGPSSEGADAGPSGAVGAGVGPSSSAPVATLTTDAKSQRGPPKTVPINPLVPASKHLARVLGQASAKTGQIAAVTLTPVGSAVARGATTVGRRVGSVLGKIGHAISTAASATVQKIKDIWPWRGPPPE